MNNIDNIIKVLSEKDNFMITAHLNPDGDAIGSCLGLGLALKKYDKKFQIIFDSTIPEKFRNLPGANDIANYSEDLNIKFVPEVIIFLDTPSRERAGKVKELVPDNIFTINVDHHVSNSNFGDLNLVDHKASSTAEIIYQIIDNMKIDIDKEIAETIYTGILIDTGRFRFSNTTPKCLSISSKLIEYGASPENIAEWLFHTSNIETLKGLEEVLKNVEVFLNGKFASSVLTKTFLEKTSYDTMDTEGFVNYPLSLINVEVAALFHEMDENKTRVSLRSKSGHVDVNSIAEVFGGGGHSRAAGLKYEGKLEDIKQLIINEVKKKL